MAQEWTIPLRIRLSLGGSVPAAAEAMATDAALSGRALSCCPSLTGGRESLEGASLISDSYQDKFCLASLTKPDFDWRKALSLALASRLSYAKKGEVERVAKDVWRLRTCEVVAADDTQCFVATSADAVLVSFRGSYNVGDWLSNLNMSITTRPYGAVHRGFLAGFQVVQEPLEALLGKYPARPVILTGHSRGGALALIAASEWKDKYKIAAIHTFGQPAVGQASFTEFFEKAYARKYYRFVNNQDIVPRVPPWFEHCGWLLHFDAHQGLHNEIASEELAALEVALDPLPSDTKTMSEEQFNRVRARLLQLKVESGGAPLGEDAVQQAAAESGLVEPHLEGLFPGASDHRIDGYVAKVASHAGV